MILPKTHSLALGCELWKEKRCGIPSSLQTPTTKTQGTILSQTIVMVPILRAGLGLIEGFIKLLPDAEKGHIGLYRDEQTYKPVEYLFKLPKIKNNKNKTWR